jgi:hypothetical protein
LPAPAHSADCAHDASIAPAGHAGKIIRKHNGVFFQKVKAKKNAMAAFFKRPPANSNNSHGKVQGPSTGQFTCHRPV